MLRRFSEAVHVLTSGRSLLTACQCWQILIAKANTYSIITYGDLSKIMNIHHRPLNYILGHIMNFCEENELPPLTSIVVNQDTGLPGVGFTAEEAENVPSAHIQVLLFNWFDLIPPSVADFREFSGIDVPPEAEE